MRRIDRVLQNWRARMARPWIPEGARVLDIGCHQGEFLDSLGETIGPSVGLDPLAVPRATPQYRLLRETFRPPTTFRAASFDAVVLLATLEHIRDKEALAGECWRLLRPGGRVILTVPSGLAGGIAHLLCKVRLADGMLRAGRAGHDPHATPDVFGAHGFALEEWRRFQLGLNHLFVFEKPAAVMCWQHEERRAPRAAFRLVLA